MSVDRRADWIARLANLGDTHEALRFKGRRLSYAELGAAAKATADRLIALGIEPGDLVAVLAAPSVEGIVLIHAMLATGVVMLPLNARLTEAEQREAIASTAARYLVVPGPGARTSDSRGHRLVGETGCGLVAMDLAEDGVAADLEILRAASSGIDETARIRRSQRVGERAALVLRTSGTSGRPKGAILAFDHLMASAHASAALLGSEASDRWLLCMPIFHIGGLSILIRSARVGACVVVHERFEARDVACAIEDEGITRVSFVPTMLERVLEVRGDERAPKALSLVLLGGGPVAADLLERAGRLGYPIAPTYGLTEAASQVATRPPRRYACAGHDSHESHDSHASHERGVGRDGEDLAAGLEVLPGVEIRIVDADRDRVAAGVAGEIQVRGPIVMCGYLEDPKATHEALRDGWLSTGDVGCLDEDGRLRVLDRRADLIVSGGENIYPAEVESILVESADVLEAGVYGIPDSEFGARPAAALVLREGAVFDSDALSAFCAHRMARYKCPVEFKRVDELPRTATGKLLRRVLRDRWEGR